MNSRSYTGRFVRLALMASVAGSAVAMGTAATAQDDGVEEILVTSARKREENVYETPAALTVFNSDMLTDRGINTVEDVGKFVPNLSVTRFGVGNPSQAAVFIRGIGTFDHLITTDPGVGVYLDGVYLSRQMGNNLNLANIARIEALRGPQGTLYGRNTLGGAVNIVTRRPGEEEIFEFSGQVGTRGRFGASFYGNTKLSDDVGLSVTGGWTTRNGVGDAINLVNPERRIGEINEFFGRAALQWDVNEKLTVLASIDGNSGNNGQSPSTIEITGAPAPGFGLPQITEADIPDRDDTATLVDGLESTSNDTFGASLTLEYELSENWDTKLLASYRDNSYSGGLDDDVTALSLSEFPETGESEQYSLELQFNGQIGAFDIVSGVYYFDEDGSNFSGPNTFTPFDSAADGAFFTLEQETRSWAVYSNVKYNVTEDFVVGGGLRYSEDDKEATALFPSFGGVPATREGNFGEVTWDLNATYAVADNLNVYAQIQRGYQTGGFPPRPFGGPAQFNVFDETTATNYEVGFKGVINDIVALSTSFYWTEYDDLALNFSDPQAGGFVTITENAGSARARGFEVEANVTYDVWFLNSSIGYNDTEITDLLPGTQGLEEGAPLPNAPEWTVGLNGGFEVPLQSGSLRGQINYSFRDALQSQPTLNAVERIDDRSLVGFNLTYTNADGDWDVQVYGENIFNEVYDQGRLLNSFHGFVGIVLSNDRSEFGLRFTKRFGG